MARPPSRRLRRALSLVELLVVAVIITLMIATLVPSLHHAREQARTTRCLANQRQLATAVLAYACQFDNFIVPAGYRDPTSPPPHTHSTETWCTLFINDGLLPPQGNQRLGTYRQPQPTPMPSGLLCCPSGEIDAISSRMPHALDDIQGQRPARYTSRSSHITVDCWYGINAGTGDSGAVGQSNHWLPARRIPADSNVQDTALARIHNAGSGDVVLFFDGVFMNQASVNPFRVNPRHQNRTATNLLFVDGHGETAPRALLPGGLDVGVFPTPSVLAHEFWQPTVTTHFPRASWTLPLAVP